MPEIAEVCEQLRGLFAQEALDDWAAGLNRMLGRWAVTPRLEHEWVGWHLHADPPEDGSWARWFASSTALAFAIRESETGRRVGGPCAAPDCARPFLRSRSGHTPAVLLRAVRHPGAGGGHRSRQRGEPPAVPQVRPHGCALAAAFAAGNGTPAALGGWTAQLPALVPAEPPR